MHNLNQSQSKRALRETKHRLKLKVINANQTKAFDPIKHDLDFIYKTNYDFSATQQEVKDFLNQFKQDFNQEKFDKLIYDCKNEVIKSIVTPFGLGKIIATYKKTRDIDGGNVDTIYNVRKDIYATTEEQEKYNNKGDYDSDEYHQDPNYVKINKKYSELRKQGKAKDYMTGEPLDVHQSHDLDHKVSAKEIHDDKGRVLAEIEGIKLANTDTNLSPTTSTNNRSKNAHKMEDFIARKNENLKKIEALKAKENLSEQDVKLLNKLEKLAKIDDKRALEADKQARGEINQEINKTYYTSKKFVKNLGITSVNEASKMGAQQAIGLIMTEFFAAVFDEILDIYKNGYESNFEDTRFLNILKKRLATIGRKIKARWKDIAIAFKDGFISGFISNLVTTTINVFVTTAKNVVRIIREGIFSLFKAIKLLIFPPENMTYEEALHEAKKIIASAFIISAGIIIEELIQKLICNMPFASTITAIFVGAMTGIAVTMVVYYIDQQKNNNDEIKKIMEYTENCLKDTNRLLLKTSALR